MTGDKTNLSQHENNPDFEFIQGDIRNNYTVKKGVKDVDGKIHVTLIRVTKSIEDSLLSNNINNNIQKYVTKK